MRRLICMILMLLAVPSWADKPPPEVVAIKGVEYRLETYLWRDFMPISPPDGKPLKASVSLVAVDGKSLPPKEIVWERLWIISAGKLEWETKLHTQPRGGAASDGPKLIVGTKVTVQVQFKDKAGKSYFISAPKQLIHRTS